MTSVEGFETSTSTYFFSNEFLNHAKDNGKSLQTSTRSIARVRVISGTVYLIRFANTCEISK